MRSERMTGLYRSRGATNKKIDWQPRPITPLANYERSAGMLRRRKAARSPKADTVFWSELP
jgi:hypothetical protein